MCFCYVFFFWFWRSLEAVSALFATFKHVVVQKWVHFKWEFQSFYSPFYWKWRSRVEKKKEAKTNCFKRNVVVQPRVYQYVKRAISSFFLLKKQRISSSCYEYKLVERALCHFTEFESNFNAFFRHCLFYKLPTWKHIAIFTVKRRHNA